MLLFIHETIPLVLVIVTVLKKLKDCNRKRGWIGGEDRCGEEWKEQDEDVKKRKGRGGSQMRGWMTTAGWTGNAARELDPSRGETIQLAGFVRAKD